MDDLVNERKCDKIFDEKFCDLGEHYIKKTNEEYKCGLCGKMFIEKSIYEKLKILIDDINTGNNTPSIFEEPVKCEIKEEFENVYFEDDLLEIQESKIETHEIIENECNRKEHSKRINKDKKILNIDIRKSKISCIDTNYKSNPLKNLKCDQCDDNKTFSKFSDLKIHVDNVHQQLKNNKCDICGKDFSKQIGLKTHIKNVHEGQKNYKCDHCDKYLSLIHI